MAEPFRFPPRLTPQERNQHVANCRALAQQLPDQRAELLRAANNLLAAGRIRRKLALQNAQRNQHPQHPTRQ